VSQPYGIPRYTGVVFSAEPRCSYLVRRLDDGIAVTLSRREANRTNYRLRIGDRIELSVYQSVGRWHGFNVRRSATVSRSASCRHTMPWGPVVRVGVRER
jgi:hypothetical protein